MTTTTKHTPGPWTYAYDEERLAYAIWQTARECSAYPQRIATVTRREDGAEEANARLIASAPALVEALKMAERVIWRAMEGTQQPGSREYAAVVKALREAGADG